MAKRVVLAGILGGLTLFVWLFVVHEFLGIDESAEKEIPNEANVLGSMQASITEAGFYIFPGFGLGPKPTQAQRNEAMPGYMKKYEVSPHGILIYHPPSGPFSFGGLLGRQGALNLIEGLLAAWLVAWVAAERSFTEKVGFVFVVGVFAAISTNVEYWNWYEFPTVYTVPYMLSQIVGYTLTGCVIAALIKKAEPARS
jgi:hypothetical protein